MSDHSAPSDHLLGLLSQKAVHQIVRLMAASEEPTTFRKITTHVPHGTPDATRLLRSLATEGFIRRCGSWGMEPTPETRFELTNHGHELIMQLDRLDEWAGRRASRVPTHRRSRLRWRDRHDST